MYIFNLQFHAKFKFIAILNYMVMTMVRKMTSNKYQFSNNNWINFIPGSLLLYKKINSIDEAREANISAKALFDTLKIRDDLVKFYNGNLQKRDDKQELKDNASLEEICDRFQTTEQRYTLPEELSLKLTLVRKVFSDHVSEPDNSLVGLFSKLKDEVPHDKRAGVESIQRNAQEKEFNKHKETAKKEFEIYSNLNKLKILLAEITQNDEATKDELDKIKQLDTSYEASIKIFPNRNFPFKMKLIPPSLASHKATAINADNKEAVTALNFLENIISTNVSKAEYDLIIDMMKQNDFLSPFKGFIKNRGRERQFTEFSHKYEKSILNETRTQEKEYVDGIKQLELVIANLAKTQNNWFSTEPSIKELNSLVSNIKVLRAKDRDLNELTGYIADCFKDETRLYVKSSKEIQEINNKLKQIIKNSSYFEKSYPEHNEYRRLLLKIRGNLLYHNNPGYKFKFLDKFGLADKDRLTKEEISNQAVGFDFNEYMSRIKDNKFRKQWLGRGKATDAEINLALRRLDNFMESPHNFENSQALIDIMEKLDIDYYTKYNIQKYMAYTFIGMIIAAMIVACVLFPPLNALVAPFFTNAFWHSALNLGAPVAAANQIALFFNESIPQFFVSSSEYFIGAAAATAVFSFLALRGFNLKLSGDNDAKLAPGLKEDIIINESSDEKSSYETKMTLSNSSVFSKSDVDVKNQLSTTETLKKTTDFRRK